MRRLAVAAAGVIAGCVPYRPPAPPAPNDPVPVDASFGHTWDAVIDVFAERNIGIETIDRSSGLIVAARARVATDTQSDMAYAASLADCGTTGEIRHVPGAATYNIVVRGDSARSAVRVNVRFIHFPRDPNARPVECSSRGVWEEERVAEIKARAESKASQ